MLLVPVLISKNMLDNRVLISKDIPDNRVLPKGVVPNLLMLCLARLLLTSVDLLPANAYTVAPCDASLPRTAAHS